jgi:hypothetical protein
VTFRRYSSRGLRGSMRESLRIDAGDKLKVFLEESMLHGSSFVMKLD